MSFLNGDESDQDTTENETAEKDCEGEDDETRHLEADHELYRMLGRQVQCPFGPFLFVTEPPCAERAGMR